MAVERLLGGFAKGFAQGRVMKAEREREKEKSDLHKKYIQAQTKQMDFAIKKAEAELQDRTNANLILQSMGMTTPKGGEPQGPAGVGGVEPTSFGTSFQEGKTESSGGITDQLATAQLAFMNPMVAEYLSRSGMDVPGMSKVARDQLRFLRDYERKKHFTYTDPSGKEVTLEIPQYGSAVGGGTRVLSTGPEPLETYTYTEGDRELEGVRNAQTKEVKNVKPIPKKPPPATPAETAAKLTSAVMSQNHVQRIRDLIIDPNTGQVNKFIVGLIALKIGVGAEIESLFKEAVDSKIRGMTGAAVNKDEWPMYNSMYLPSLRDLTQPGLIEDKLNRFEKWIDAYVNVLDPDGTKRKRMNVKESGSMTETDLPDDVDLVYDPKTGKLEPVK